MAQQVKTDWILFGAVLGLVAAGLLMLASASWVVAEVKYGSSWLLVLRQVVWACAALFLMLLLKRWDYRRFNTSPWAYGSMLVILLLLMLVYVLDPRLHRWFRLGPVNLQPSEFAKPVLIVFLAHFAARRASVINRRRTLICAAVIVSLVTGLVIAADLGTAVVIAAAAAVLFLVAGLERRFALVAGLILFLLISIAVAWKPYRIARIFGHVNPDYPWLDTALVRTFDAEGKAKAWLKQSAPTRDSTYHITQSLIAVGSGGILGTGPMRGRQKLLYLPEAHTDFIYAVIAEELGLWGALLFAGGFVVIAWRGMRIHFRAPDDFGRFVALGVTTMVTVQAFMNISVVTGLLPPKGIPLPLVSYGGSSLMSSLISLGILQSIGDQSG